MLPYEDINLSIKQYTFKEQGPTNILAVNVQRGFFFPLSVAATNWKYYHWAKTEHAERYKLMHTESDHLPPHFGKLLPFKSYIPETAHAQS